MDVWQALSLFSVLDGAAVALLLAAWVAIDRLIEREGGARPSTSHVMRAYRRAWMQVLVTRQPRILDGNILATLRQGTSFFASATMIAIGGGLALLGNTEQLRGLARDLTLDTAPALVWEVKILFVLMIVANAFLQFVWSHRLFGYCAVVMASVPNEPDHPEARLRAARAGEINITAARSFNRGLRAVYFALAALAWFLGPAALAGAALATVWVLWRREFASTSRRILLGEMDGAAAQGGGAGGAAPGPPGYLETRD